MKLKSIPHDFRWIKEREAWARKAMSNSVTNAAGGKNLSGTEQRVFREDALLASEILFEGLRKESTKWKNPEVQNAISQTLIDFDHHYLNFLHHKISDQQFRANCVADLRKCRERLLHIGVDIGEDKIDAIVSNFIDIFAEIRAYRTHKQRQN